MKKYLALISVFALVCLLFVPVVSASVLASNSGVVNGNLPVQYIHPTGNPTYNSAAGQTFTASATQYVSNISLRLEKIAGTQNANFSVVLCSVTGSAGSRYASTTLETSSVINSDDMSVAANDYVFYFLGTTQLTGGQIYGFYLKCDGATTLTSSYYVAVEMSAVTNTGMNSFHFHNGWDVDAAHEIIFVINGQTGSGAATPTPAPPDSTGDGGMTLITNALLPILVPLLVVLIPAFLGLKFVGTWGFMAGLNVGVIIAYVTLSTSAYAFPLWGVVLVGIVDVLLVMKARG